MVLSPASSAGLAVQQGRGGGSGLVALSGRRQQRRPEASPALCRHPAKTGYLRVLAVR